MTIYTRNFNTSCIDSLLIAINEDSSIDNVLDQIVQDTSAGTADFNFQGSLTSAEETSLDNILSGWSCPIEGSVDNVKYLFAADQFLNPSTTGWAVSNIATPSVDTLNNELIVRRFDDTTEEGVGFIIKTPIYLNTFTLVVRGRAQSAPTALQTAYLKVYFKEIPDGGTIGSWQNYSIGQLDIPSGSSDWHYTTMPISASTMGLSPNTVYLIEITRDTSNVDDDLSGDFVLLDIEIELY